MKKLLISAFVASMFAGGHAFAGENIPLAAALGTGAAVTVAAAGGAVAAPPTGLGLLGPGSAVAITTVVAAGLAVASEAGGKSTTNH